MVPERMGNAHPSSSPYELYDAGDGQLVIAVGNDRPFCAREALTTARVPAGLVNDVGHVFRRAAPPALGAPEPGAATW